MEKQQLEKYINEYGRDIYLFCKRLTQNKNTADDLYQETFLKLWEFQKLSAWYCCEFVEKSVPQANVAKTDCRHCTGFGRKSD